MRFWAVLGGVVDLRCITGLQVFCSRRLNFNKGVAEQMGWSFAIENCSVSRWGGGFSSSRHCCDSQRNQMIKGVEFELFLTEGGGEKKKKKNWLMLSNDGGRNRIYQYLARRIKQSFCMRISTTYRECGDVGDGAETWRKIKHSTSEINGWGGDLVTKLL